MDNKEYVLTEGTRVSYWYQGKNYATVKYVCNWGVTLHIYKVVRTDSYSSPLYYDSGDIAFFAWASCPNLKFEKFTEEDKVSYASWT